MQTLNVSVATHLSCLKCDCSAPQLSNLSVWTCFCPSKYPMAHLLHEEVELLDVKWGFKDPRALLWEQSVSGSRRKAGCWVPLDGICVPGHSYNTGHFISCLCLSRLSPLKPHPRAFASFKSRNMFHFDKLTVVTYKEARFLTAELTWLKTMN